MKRPLLPLTLGVVIAVWCTLHYDVFSIVISYRVPVMLAMFVLGALIVRFKKLSFIVTFFIGAFIGLVLTMGYTHLRVRPVQALEGQSLTITATVLDTAQQYEDSQRVKVCFLASQTKSIPVKLKVRSLIYLPHTDHKLLPGDKIVAHINFYSPEVLDGFDRRAYYAADGYHILARSVEDTASALTVIPAKRTPFWAYPMKFSQAVKTKLDILLPEKESGFMKAILLGDKSGLSSSNLLSMKKAGLSHVMAVSGMHIGFLVGFFFLLFGRKYGMLLSIVAILFFIPMTGATPSVLRAGIMYLIASVGFFLGKEKNSLNALCGALLILLFCNPYAIQSVSLQLSFAATLGLIVLNPRLKNWCMKFLTHVPRTAKHGISLLLDSIICSVSSLCFTAPILFVSFGYVSVFAPFANFITIGVIAVIFILGIIACVATALMPAIAGIFATCLTILIRYVLMVAEKVASLPYGLVYTDQLYGKIAILIFCITIFVIAFFAPRIKLRFVLPPTFIVLIILSAANMQDERNTMHISFLPSGSGQTIVIATGQKNCDPIVIDCSGGGHREAEENVADWMTWWGYDRIDTLVLTSVDKTHARNVPSLLYNIEVGRIIIPDKMRQSVISTEILHTAGSCSVPVKAWGRGVSLLQGTSAYQIFLNGAVERKLIVQIKAGQEDILIVHSLTQKMLQKVLSEQSLDSNTVVLSESNLENGDMLDDALEKIGAKDIILQSGYSTLTKILGRPVRNTMLEGEITLRIPLGSRGGR